MVTNHSGSRVLIESATSTSQVGTNASSSPEKGYLMPAHLLRSSKLA